MNTEDLIPKFEVGERVIVHIKNYEMCCPVCHKPIVMKRAGQDVEGIIIPKDGWPAEYPCGCWAPFPDGFYGVLVEDEKKAIPYTLLERVEGRG